MTCTQGESGTCRQPVDLTLANVQATIDASASTDDDTYHDGVYLIAGTQSWTDYLTLNKHGLVLKGAGSSSTILQANRSAGYHWLVVSNGNHVRITGIGFDSPTYSNTYLIQIGGTNIRMDHNAFTAPGGAATAIHALGKTTGVIDANTFGAGIGGSFLLQEAPMTNWDNPVAWGTADFLFFENNTIASSGNPDAIEAHKGGKIVARYNTFTESGTGIMAGLVELHNAFGAPDGILNGRAIEAYNNRVNMTTVDASDRRLGHIRGGTALVYNNVLDYSVGGHNQTIWFVMRDFRAQSDCGTTGDTGDYFVSGTFEGACCATTYHPNGAGNYPEGEGYPCVQAPGQGVRGGAAEPIYFWNNQKTSDGSTLVDAGSGQAGLADSSAAWAIALNTDYFISVSKPAALSGYSPYVCPHPLTGLSPNCSASVAGTAGYNPVGGPPPAIAGGLCQGCQVIQ